MFKINSYSLFFFVLFFNSSNVHVFSFNWDPIDAINIFPNTNTPPPESGVGIHPLFPIQSSVTPQPYNLHLNNSTSTFMPFGWAPNNSTDIFNINYFSLPIGDEIGDFNDTFSDTNDNIPLLIPDDSNKSNAMGATSTSKPFLAREKTPPNQCGQKALKNNKPAKTYMCPRCNKKYVKQGAFKKHVKMHDNNKPNPYACTLCDKSFAKKSTLKIHVQRHSNEKPFKCDYCPKRFKSKQERATHHRVHTKERPYKCNYCNVCFTAPSTLKRHLIQHTGVKPFKCKYCNKGLNTNIALQGHLNTCQGKKPYKCTQCTKAYATRGGFKNHIKQHNKVTYTCHYCNAAFTSKSEYKNHILYEEETDEDRRCHICKKVYKDKRGLQKHNTRYHSKA